ncbi:hypothetical protein O6H91_20G061500 [Diphasiastrum complanatum]|uniref:Uncharacterized protein n=2 Tax=Diphasiastrum complanatum TaxID=34168 RepID=A0ACC2AQY4_DIPCM|nr:hypothetical protein O6H91_20G061500 [Diphasiastrum complanatum]KAJ7519963.1 hypothetical protein O6H91_20G061500 [Diphasiastrum complanatum]
MRLRIGGEGMADVCKCLAGRSTWGLPSLQVENRSGSVVLIRRDPLKVFRSNNLCSLRKVSESASNRLRVVAQLVEFKAKRCVSIPYKDGGFPAEDYLQEVERVVKITFPDSARIQYLGNSSWRSRLRPITFFSVSATPVCDLKVFHEEKTQSLKLRSDKLVLDLLGLPTDNLDLQFSLEGDLKVSRKSTISRQKNFNGSVSLGLKCDLPLPFSLMPETVVMPVGDGVLDRILGAMEGALLQGIIKDYNYWCRIQRSLKQPTSGILRSAPT